MDNGAPVRARPYRGVMAVDPSLTDDQLKSEIDLVGALVLAAGQSGGPMSQDDIDEVLGVEGEEDDEASVRAAPEPGARTPEPPDA